MKSRLMTADLFLPVGPHTFKYDIVCVECLEVDPGGQCRVHALGQALGDDNPSRDDRVLHVRGQHLVQLLQGRDQVRPLSRVLEGLQRLVNGGHVAGIKREKNDYKSLSS